MVFRWFWLLVLSMAQDVRTVPLLSLVNVAVVASSAQVILVPVVPRVSVVAVVTVVIAVKVEHAASVEVAMTCSRAGTFFHPFWVKDPGLVGAFSMSSHIASVCPANPFKVHDLKKRIKTDSVRNISVPPPRTARVSLSLQLPRSPQAPWALRATPAPRPHRHHVDPGHHRHHVHPGNRSHHARDSHHELHRLTDDSGTTSTTRTLDTTCAFGHGQQ